MSEADDIEALYQAASDAPASSRILTPASRSRGLARYLRGLAGVLRDSGRTEDAAAVAERAQATHASAAALHEQFLRMLHEERLEFQAQEGH